MVNWLGNGQPTVMIIDIDIFQQNYDRKNSKEVSDLISDARNENVII